MPTPPPFERPTPSSISAYVKRNAAKARLAQSPHHAGLESVREADYKGHHIVVRTTYRIEVDGKPVTGHVAVSDDGQVHYHPIPNVRFASALDLVRYAIDVFPRGFGASGGGGKPPAPHGPDGPGGHGGRGATPAKQRAVARTRKTRTAAARRAKRK